MKLGPHGLVNEALGSLLDFQLQTTESLAIGYSWRTVRSASIRATLSPAASLFTSVIGQTYTPRAGQMFARYSPGTKHWSTWQVLTTSSIDRGYRFEGDLTVAQQDYDEYGKLFLKWMKLDVPWASDEEACVKWILKSQPDFFAKHIPFIGYVQFLYEGLPRRGTAH